MSGERTPLVRRLDAMGLLDLKGDVVASSVKTISGEDGTSRIEVAFTLNLTDEEAQRYNRVGER